MFFSGEKRRLQAEPSFELVTSFVGWVSRHFVRFEVMSTVVSGLDLHRLQETGRVSQKNPSIIDYYTIYDYDDDY